MQLLRMSSHTTLITELCSGQAFLANKFTIPLQYDWFGQIDQAKALRKCGGGYIRQGNNPNHTSSLHIRNRLRNPKRNDPRYHARLPFG